MRPVKCWLGHSRTLGTYEYEERYGENLKTLVIEKPCSRCGDRGEKKYVIYFQIPKRVR